MTDTITLRELVNNASTGPVEAEWVIPILLALLCRVEEPEAKRGKQCSCEYWNETEISNAPD